jgi:hypothetical protein
MWMILVSGVNLQTIRLAYASQKQQLMAIHVKITRYESSYECTPRQFLNFNAIPMFLSNKSAPF